MNNMGLTEMVNGRINDLKSQINKFKKGIGEI